VLLAMSEAAAADGLARLKGLERSQACTLPKAVEAALLVLVAAATGFAVVMG
jgi:hypothetical protein